MNISFEGKVAIVTGAGKGVGRAITKALAAGGATVHAISRTQADLDSLQQEVPGIQTHTLDLSDWDKTRRTLQSIGPVNLLVNNAAIIRIKSVFEVTKEDFELTMNTNVLAQFNVTQVVAKSMVDNGIKGAVVSISSTSGVRPDWQMSSYCISKAAVEMMTKAFALELGQHQIRFNNVLPTLIADTAMGKSCMTDPKVVDAYLERHPIGKFAETSDVVHAVLYLLSDQADMITGTSLAVDGGLLVD